MVFFFQAEDGIRDLVRSRGLGDVYKRQEYVWPQLQRAANIQRHACKQLLIERQTKIAIGCVCLLYTSDAADERSSVDLGGRRIIKKKIHSTNRA